MVVITLDVGVIATEVENKEPVVVGVGVAAEIMIYVDAVDLEVAADVVGIVVNVLTVAVVE